MSKKSYIFLRLLEYLKIYKEEYLSYIKNEKPYFKKK